MPASAVPKPKVAAIMFAVGVLVSLVAYFPLINRPPSTVFISTLLIGIVLQNVFLVLFGPQAHAAPPLIQSGILHAGPVEISIQALGTLVVAGALIALQYLVFAHTQIGRRLRATGPAPAARPGPEGATEREACAREERRS